jgi:transposase
MPAKRKSADAALRSSRNREIERKFEKLEQQFQQLQKLYIQLQKQHAQLQAKSQQQQARIEELEAKLAKAQKTSRNSSKPPSSDITKPPSPAAATAPDGKPKQGAQPGHEKSTRPDFTAEQIDHIQRISLGGCPCCGGNLAELDTPPETFQQIEVAARPVFVTEYQRSSGWCEHCQNTFKPDWPPGLVEAGLTGPGLIALIGFLKGGCSMSIGTIKRYLRDCLQLHLSKGYIAKLLNRITGCLDEPYAELERLLPNEPLVNVDETGHKDNGKRFWTWVFRAEMFTFFRVSPSRGSEVLLDVLGQEFDGLLGCDYFSAYRKYMKLNENVRLQFCLAHLIRDVKFLITHPTADNREHGEQLLELLRKMFSIIHRRGEYETEAGYRNALSRVRNEFVYKAAMEAPQTEEALNLSERFFKHTESYFQFITEPAIDPTNNVAEQAFRFVAIQRRITQGTRGRAGQLWSERIWTVIATCKQQGRSAYEYLVTAITASCRQQPVPSLIFADTNSS